MGADNGAYEEYGPLVMASVLLLAAALGFYAGVSPFLGGVAVILALVLLLFQADGELAWVAYLGMSVLSLAMGYWVYDTYSNAYVEAVGVVAGILLCVGTLLRARQFHAARPG